MNKSNNKRPLDMSVSTGRSFLNDYAKGEKRNLSFAVLSGSLSTVLLLAQWLMFSFIADAVILQHEAVSDYSIFFILLACCLLGRALLTRIQSFLSEKASINIRKAIRHKMLFHWCALSPVSLQNTSSGAFATQFVEDVEAMDGYFSRYWPQQALAVISPLLILSVIAYLNWLCALLLLISAPLIPLFMVLVGMRAEQLNQKYSTMRQRLAGHFFDRVSNLSSIKLLGAQTSIFQEVEGNSDQYRKVIMKTLKVAFLSSTVLEFFTSVAIAGLAIYIGFALYGAITWGPAESISLFTGLTILILAPEFFQPLRSLSQFYHDRAAALGAANNLVASLAFKEEGIQKLDSLQVIDETDNSFELDVTAPQNTCTYLRLSNLSVGYETPLMQPLNVELEAGSMLVVSGHSGSGKTSLLNTIAGFIPALEGEVCSNTSGNQAISYLPQKAWVKDGSVFENLSALAPKASKDDMLKALKQLGLDDELGIKHLGIDTPIGEHGQGLSGGQMQRIAFARVMLNPTSIVLLDEPTAKLDSLSKEYIIAALKILKSQRIVVIASHDPLLIDMSDIHINLNLSKVDA